LLDDAAAQCRAAGIEPIKVTLHDTPVAGILAIAKTHSCDLIVMGTHARTGVARAFLGSTTVGVLRWGHLPVLTVRASDRIAPAPFASVLVAVDDSAPSDAAAAVAASLARSAGSSVTVCSVVETANIYENSVDYGFNPDEVISDIQAEVREHVRATLEHAQLPADTPVAIVDGDPVDKIIATAQERHVTLIVTGTHGRRGIRRLFLGSVAEALVRSSDIPVLAVPVLR